MSRTILVASLGLVLLTWQGSGVMTLAQEPDPCADAVGLVTEGEYEAAEARYIELLDDPEARSCAIAGLQNLGVARQNDQCAVGDALAEAGEEDEARKAYLEDIKHPAERECALEGLNETRSWVDGPVDALGAPLEALLKLVGIAILVLFIVRIGRTARRRQFVLADLTDATGLQEFEKQSGGLSQLLRQHVADELDRLGQAYQEAVALTRTNPPPGLSPPQAGAVSLYPPPRARLDTTAADLASAMKEVPGGVGQVIPAIVNTLFRPRGVSVGGYFQRQGQTPDRLGISIEVSDLRSRHEATLFTVWEATGPPVTDLLSPASSREVRGRTYRVVAAAAARAGRHMDSLRFAGEAQQLNPSADGLLFVQQVQAQAELQRNRSKHYRTGKALQEARQIEAAIDHYVLALPEEQPEARAQWRTALGGAGQPAAEALRWLAPRYIEALLVHEGLELLGEAEVIDPTPAADERLVQAREAADALIQASSLLTEILDFDSAESFATEVAGYVKDDLRAASLLAEIRVRRAGEGSKALGHVLVGRAYRNVGAPAEARKAFIAALEEQPLVIAAAEGLTETLGLSTTPSQRLERILPAASRLLALDVLRRRQLESG